MEVPMTLIFCTIFDFSFKQKKLKNSYITEFCISSFSKLLSVKFATGSTHFCLRVSRQSPEEIAFFAQNSTTSTDRSFSKLRFRGQLSWACAATSIYNSRSQISLKQWWDSYSEDARNSTSFFKTIVLLLLTFPSLCNFANAKFNENVITRELYQRSVELGFKDSVKSYANSKNLCIGFCVERSWLF